MFKHRNPRWMLAALTIGTALIGFGLLQRGWLATWRTLGVPSLLPTFSDMRVIQGAIATVAMGGDPQVNNVGDALGQAMNYPLIWLSIAQALGLGDEAHFIAFVLACLTAYLVCIVLLLREYPSWWLLAMVFSGAGLMLVERGNTDLMIFVLLYLAAAAPRAWAAAGLIFTATVLKLYPLFALLSIVKHRWATGGLLLASACLMLLTLESVQKAVAATPTAATMSYGTPSMAKAIGLVFPQWPVHPHAITAVVVMLSLGMGLITPLHRRLAPGQAPERVERMFMVGASIYVLSFIASSNWDYRLMVLALCLPCLLHLRHPGLRLLLMMALLLAVNQPLIFKLLGMTAGGALSMGSKVLLFCLLAQMLCRLVWRDLTTHKGLDSGMGGVAPRIPTMPGLPKP